jgi:hypothetical protein
VEQGCGQLDLLCAGLPFVLDSMRTPTPAGATCSLSGGMGGLLKDHTSDYKHLQTFPKVSSCIDVWRSELENDIDRDYLLNG